MLQSLKVWKLSGALKAKGNPPGAYAAVIELGQIGTAAAIDLLIESLSRRDGVSRSAARELGRLGTERAVEPLAALLAHPEVNQSAAEALIKLGSKAVGALSTALQSEVVEARKLAAGALGEIGDKRAVEALVRSMETDNDYAVRTAAATALGQLKDAGAIWVLVGTLKLRDETTPERQAALEQLRQATTLALRKIGDPFAVKSSPAPISPEALVEQMEAKIADSEVHPRLIGDLSLLSDRELASVLKELIGASEEISWANLENREPILPAWFKSYDQRRNVAVTVGAEFHRRGGQALMDQILEKDLGGYSAIANWWADLAAE